MHHIYHTEGFVISSIDKGEANRFLTIFTRELGVVHGMVQGVRKLSSKLRYSLQDFSHSSIDLVRGKDVWRITSATKNVEFDGVFENPIHRACVGNIFRLVRRMCYGEDPNEEVFMVVRDFYQFLSVVELSEDRARALELVVGLRILYHLGYVSETTEMSSFLQENISYELLDKVLSNRSKIITLINHALAESHL